MASISIITIGDELLIGQTIDTNSAWMAQELGKAGFLIKRRVAVGDASEEITKAMNEESIHSDIILITGGLGPTGDDITKPLLCKYFGSTIVINEAALENVKYLFEQVFKRELTERNIKQAEVPDNCTVIQNKRGTAPGMLFEKDGKIFVSMPGVPHEMQGMMNSDVIPYLQQHFKTASVIHRTMVTFGIGESAIADKIVDFENNLPSNIKLAYLPNYGMVRLRLSQADDNGEEIINKQFNNLQELLREFMVTNLDEPMEAVLGKLLNQKEKTISTAESCTGGLIAHTLTTLPGASVFFMGSIISYSNDIKINQLNVEEAVLNTEGAVSEQVVLQMQKAVIKKLGTDYALAVSGIMGPNGGTETKPVGTVWIAVGNKERQIAQKFHFRFDRKKNTELTVVNALNLMRKFILEEDR
jgi:nicotinamide-nucleotide amidase